MSWARSTARRRSSPTRACSGRATRPSCAGRAGPVPENEKDGLRALLPKLTRRADAVKYPSILRRGDRASGATLGARPPALGRPPQWAPAHGVPCFAGRRQDPSAPPGAHHRPGAQKDDTVSRYTSSVRPWTPPCGPGVSALSEPESEKGDGEGGRRVHQHSRPVVREVPPRRSRRPTPTVFRLPPPHFEALSAGW